MKATGATLQGCWVSSSALHFSPAVFDSPQSYDKRNRQPSGAKKKTHRQCCRCVVNFECSHTITVVAAPIEFSGLSRHRTSGLCRHREPIRSMDSARPLQREEPEPGDDADPSGCRTIRSQPRLRNWHSLRLPEVRPARVPNDCHRSLRSHHRSAVAVEEQLRCHRTRHSHLHGESETCPIHHSQRIRSMAWTSSEHHRRSRCIRQPSASCPCLVAASLANRRRCKRPSCRSRTSRLRCNVCTSTWTCDVRDDDRSRRPSHLRCCRSHRRIRIGIHRLPCP